MMNLELCKLWLKIKWDSIKRNNPFVHKVMMMPHEQRLKKAREYDGDDEFHESYDMIHVI